MLSAALLHDVVEDIPSEHVTLRIAFGAEIAGLVEQVTTLDGVNSVAEANTAVQAMTDHRAVHIKLADRLHNMRTVSYLTPEKQRRKSWETLEFFAPLARTLGLDDIEREFAVLAAETLVRTEPVPAGPPEQSNGPGISRRLLTAMLVLLPATGRDRWLAEWSGELAALTTRRARARFVWEVFTGMPRLTITLRHSKHL